MTPLTTLMLLALAGVGGTQPTRIETAKFRLDSPAFTPGGEIPRKHTCEGADVSPALSWSQAPAGTVSVGYEVAMSQSLSIVPYANFLGSTGGHIRFNDTISGVSAKTSLIQLGVGLTLH